MPIKAFYNQMQSNEKKVTKRMIFFNKKVKKLSSETLPEAHYLPTHQLIDL